MSYPKFNAEGYYDPTPYEALNTPYLCPPDIKHPFHPIVYICSPLSGDMERNMEAARRYSAFAVKEGYLPITPHLLYPQFMDDTDPKQRSLGLFFGLVLITKCRELWVFGNLISEGMTQEIRKAQAKCIPIRYFNSDCTENPSAIERSIP